MLREFSLMEHEGYKKAYEKWTEIKTQLDQAEEVLQTLLFKGKPASVRSQRDKQVQAILEGQDPDEVRGLEKWHEDIGRASQRRNLLTEANSVQEREVSEQRMIASKNICEKVKPDYMEDMKQAFLELINLAETLVVKDKWDDAFREGDVGYTSYLPVVSNFGLGNPRDHNSRFAYFLKEAVKEGFIILNDIPREYREAWYRSGGFKFPGDKLTSKPYNEAEYATRLKAKTVNAVLDKTRNNGETPTKNV